MFAVPSNETPPNVLALASAVVVAESATAIFADPSKDVPPIVLAVASVVAVVAFPSSAATIVQAVPETTSEESDASGINVNFPAESSYPRNAVFAADPV